MSVREFGVKAPQASLLELCFIGNRKWCFSFQLFNLLWSWIERSFHHLVPLQQISVNCANSLDRHPRVRGKTDEGQVECQGRFLRRVERTPDPPPLERRVILLEKSLRNHSLLWRNTHHTVMHDRVRRISLFTASRKGILVSFEPLGTPRKVMANSPIS